MEQQNKQDEVLIPETSENNNTVESNDSIVANTQTVKEEPEVFVLTPAVNDIKEELKEPTAFDLLSNLNIEPMENIEEDLEMRDSTEAIPIYQDIIKFNKCLPNYDPSQMGEFTADKEMLENFDKKPELSNAIFSLGVVNSDMDAVFSNGTTENYFNHTMFNKIKFYGDTIKTKTTTDSAGFLDMLDDATGMAMPITVPLWNSGIWVALKTPDEPQIIALKYFAAEKEKQLGASTGSTVYSNQSVLYTKTAMDLFFNLIVFSNVNCKKEELRKLILASDINLAISGLAQAIYLDGVDYYRTCSNFTSKKKPCNHSFKAKIRLQNATHTDFSKMSEAQLYHMAKKSPGSVTKEEVLAYQEEFSSMFKVKREYEMGDVKVIVNYKVPTIEHYLNQGEYWLNKLNKTAALILSKLDKKDDFKKTGYSTQMKTDLLGSYLHYFESVTLVKGEVVKSSSNLKELSQSIERFSKDIALYDKILNDILAIIRNGTISIIGLPEYECSSCKKMNTDSFPEANHSFKKIIPFNVLQLLFTLGDLRFMEIEERE